MNPTYKQLQDMLDAQQNTLNAQQKTINELLRFKDDYYSQRRTAFTYIKNLLQIDKEAKIGFFGVDPVKQAAAIADASGGATVDTNARTALNSLLATLRTYGIIKP